MNTHQLPVDAALDSLRSTIDGLTSVEAARRLQHFGANRGALVVTQLVNVHLCRSSRSSAFVSAREWNPLIMSGMAIEIALMLVIAYTPAGQAVFGTADRWLPSVPLEEGHVEYQLWSSYNWYYENVERQVLQGRRALE